MDHNFALVWVGFVVFYIMTLQLKYSFRQIKDLMKRNLRTRNSVFLIDVIHKHNYCSELTLEYNKIFRYLLAINYSSLTSIINIAVYLTVLYLKSILYWRIFYALIAITLH